MILFSTLISPRLRYVCDFIGRQICTDSIRITDNPEEFKRFNGPRINYSLSGICENEFRVIPKHLLFENGIHNHELNCTERDGLKIFFQTEGDLSFDVFAAVFYLLSRYEEYLPHAKDSYGRYAHENSLAWREGFLNRPLVNEWMEYLKARLQQHFPSFNRQHSAFKILPTYDIDEAYSFKHKSWWRSTGGAVKDLYKGNFNRYRQRRRVLSGKIQDPFDSYDWLDDLHERYNLEPRYFFLVADKTGKYDRNILPREGALRALIYRHADRYKIGVHPSWQSGDQPELVKKEIQTVADAGGINVDSSRQHFIRFTLPGTYRQLIEAGITEDFSMGYGSINGFRASVVAPFYWFDLEKEQATKLLLYPFCFMEANSFFEQKQSPEQALEEMLHYYRVIKEVNGLMVMIWHNTFLGTDELFKGWRVCYERFWSELVRGY